MSEGRFYWLKLKRDFFKRHDIRIVEGMPNGKDYVLFYLKLLCESVDHEGNLRFSDSVPYNAEMLATITDTNIDVVRSAVKVFTELEMMQIQDDGTIYMNEVARMLGSAVDNPNANRQRAFREKQKSLALSEHYEPVIKNNACVIKNNESKSKRKDTDKELDTDKEERGCTPQEIVDLFNEICISFPKVRALSEARKKAIKARLHQYRKEDFEALFRKAEESDFLKGQNDRNWQATFDWLITDRNMAKVLDGNYDRKKGKYEAAYGMIAEWAQGC